MLKQSAVCVGMCDVTLARTCYVKMTYEQVEHSTNMNNADLTKFYEMQFFHVPSSVEEILK